MHLSWKEKYHKKDVKSWIENPYAFFFYTLLIIVLIEPCEKIAVPRLLPS